MATQGQYLGKWPGEWFGSLATDPNAMAASLYGSSSVNASLTYATTEMVAALYGSGSISASLGFAQGGAAPDYKVKKRYLVKIGDKLVSFARQEDAINALEPAKQPAKQYPTKKGKKAPDLTESAKPEETYSLPDIESLAKHYEAYKQYQELLRKQRYDELLALYQVLQEREEEDIEILLML